MAAATRRRNFRLFGYLVQNMSDAELRTMRECVEDEIDYRRGRGHWSDEEEPGTGRRTALEDPRRDPEPEAEEYLGEDEPAAPHRTRERYIPPEPRTDRSTREAPRRTASGSIPSPVPLSGKVSDRPATATPEREVRDPEGRVLVRRRHPRG